MQRRLTVDCRLKIATCTNVDGTSKRHVLIRTLRFFEKVYASVNTLACLLLNFYAIYICRRFSIYINIVTTEIPNMKTRGAVFKSGKVKGGNSHNNNLEHSNYV